MSLANGSSSSPLTAQACWVVAPGQAEIRSEQLPALAEGEVRVRTLHSGVSRGTEGLVFRGEVPASEARRMRAPFQAGDFPGPVKYGYVNVGVVEAGPSELLGRTVFCLYPHQTVFQLPASAVLPLPPDVPPSRAVLAANMETAINALWDANPSPGNHIAVVGGGTLGLLVAWLAARLPTGTVEVVDTNPSRAGIAAALGASFALPAQAQGNADLVIHTSGQSAGLATALGLAAFEATVLELSWYGSRPVSVPLGEAFHSQRLTLKSSQVGHVATRQRERWTHRQRLELALSMLTDPVLDQLITDSAPFAELPQVLARLAGADAPDTLCQRMDYYPQP
ncbi:zinc-binding alcohol dehydrogenase [Hydrogenophaga sp.]|uniref:zinc-dependent alcohol dehydrogenase n=1 Tax=Hydrogenophaga sp. TaxID=1904254 RepID=UPI002727C231|nr:zinc-binding alcohol dehydrogenase [Hydrogenophaga sp.]MDO9438895.1 zinc-binding alcohol dehydrogenase [Hydrogenophaga sp.]